MAHPHKRLASPEDLEARSIVLRKQILRMVHAAGAGHPGGSLSVIDILNALMTGWGIFRPETTNKDWLVLSKGHATPALYSVLASLNYLPADELLTYRQFGSRLQGHPDRMKLPGVQVSTGHLGQGLSIAAGIALGENKSKTDKDIYAVLGDGDLHEGQTWEAAMFANHYHLQNLIAILDLNNLTQHGRVKDIMAVEPLEEKWHSFGWDTLELNGHDYSEILAGLEWASNSNKPSVLLCRTIKGKGVSFMEGDPLWHSTHLSKDRLTKALKELDKA